MTAPVSERNCWYMVHLSRRHVITECDSSFVSTSVGWLCRRMPSQPLGGLTGSYRRLVVQRNNCRRKAIHWANFGFRQPPTVTMPEDSFCSATAAQGETYATWLYGETQSQARSRSLAVSLVCNQP